MYVVGVLEVCCGRCSILFLIPSILSYSMFMLCILLLGEGCGGLFGEGAVVVGRVGE